MSVLINCVTYEEVFIQVNSLKFNGTAQGNTALRIAFNNSGHHVIRDILTLYVLNLYLPYSDY